MVILPPLIFNATDTLPIGFVPVPLYVPSKYFCCEVLDVDGVELPVDPFVAEFEVLLLDEPPDCVDDLLDPPPFVELDAPPPLWCELEGGDCVAFCPEIGTA